MLLGGHFYIAANTLLVWILRIIEAKKKSLINTNSKAYVLDFPNNGILVLMQQHLVLFDGVNMQHKIKF